MFYFATFDIPTSHITVTRPKKERAYLKKIEPLLSKTFESNTTT